MRQTHSIFLLLACGMGMAQIPVTQMPPPYPASEPSQEQKMEELKVQLDQQRKMDYDQYQSVLSAHQPEISQMEADHKAQVEAWKTKDQEYHEKMKSIVEDYRDRFQKASGEEKSKLNGELKAKVDALREQLHADHKQAVDDARKAQMDALKEHRDEVRALAEKNRTEFKSLQRDFQEKQSASIHPDSSK